MRKASTGGEPLALPSTATIVLSTSRAASWLLNSGIQEASGGVARYFRSDVNRFETVSTEITAYTVSGLVYLYQITADAACLEAAVRAGRYLSRTAWRPALGTIPFECRGQGELAYFFDLGIIARGLLSLWRATGENEFLETATGCARSMDADFSFPSGHHAVLALPEKRPLEGNGRWSRHPGCYQAKAAMAWLETAEAGAGDEFRQCYDQALARHLAKHSGFLKQEPNPDRIMDRLHAYCYFLEALLPRATEPASAAALNRGTSTVAALLRDIAPVFERSDVYAQLVRLRLYAAAAGVVQFDRQAAELEVAALQSFQLDSPDGRIAGGFCFGRKAGALTPFVNPVSTVFAVQTLRMWDDYLNGRFRPKVQDLI